MNGDSPVQSPARVLVVDDVESNRYVVATWLRRAGYEVVEASTGKTALDIAATQPIDIVLLDINLPDMSGFSVCEKIKAAPATAAVPVLHVSATAVGPGDRSEGLRRGAEGYLTEPVERGELLASVAALLRGAAAQRTAIRLARRLRTLNDATLALNEAPTLDDLVLTIAREASVLFESPAVVALIVDDRTLGVTAMPTKRPVVRAWTVESIDALRGAESARKALSGYPLEGLDDIAGHPSYLAADLTNELGHRGVLLIGLNEEDPWLTVSGDSDVVLRQYARAANTAIKNMVNYNVERRIALTLQRSLLPAGVPAIPGLDVAVRYEASAVHAEVGGDFYEIFALDDERVVVAIGDVVGHSLEAAAVMAQLRTGIRSYALEGHGPSAILERLNMLLLRFHVSLTATVCCVLYHVPSGRCEIANAGHPPPLIVGPEGASYLKTGGPLLGVDWPNIKAQVLDLQRESVLLLYTDGLVERRGESLDDGFARLARVASVVDQGLDELCDRVLSEAGPAQLADDIALVAIRATREG